jgi:hypothetical protein
MREGKMSNSDHVSLQDSDRERQRNEFFKGAAFMGWAVNGIVPVIAALILLYVFL